MSNPDRVIFPVGAAQPITQKQAEQLNTPYEQQRELIKRLSAWTSEAAKTLEAYGYSTDAEIYDKAITAERLPFYDDETGSDSVLVYSYMAAIIKDAAPTEKAACEVLKRAHELRRAMLTDDKCLIANRALELGLAVAVAHATPFEKLAISGKKSKDGHKDRPDQHRKADFQALIRSNPKLVLHVTKKQDLLDIDGLQRFTKNQSPATIARWFSEIYPDQLKGGRPKTKT